MNLKHLQSERLIYLRDLLRELVARDMKVWYEGTFLGFAWTLVTPLLYVGVFFFVFQMVLVLEMRRFTSFALIGILVYGWFQSSLMQASSAASSSRDLVRRPGFTIAILPVAAVTTNLIHFLLVFPILALILLFGGSQLSAALAALPVVLAVQFLLTIGLAYLVCAASVIYRDTRHIIDVFLRVFLFISPIFYDSSLVPSEFQAVYRLNPLVPLLDAYRGTLIAGVPPDWSSLATVGVSAILLAYIGYRVFMRVSYRFVEEL